MKQEDKEKIADVINYHRTCAKKCEVLADKLMSRHVQKGRSYTVLRLRYHRHNRRVIELQKSQKSLSGERQT